MSLSSILHELLHDRFNEFKVTAIEGGASEAKLYEISTASGIFILKQQAIGAGQSQLANELRNYQWLDGKVPVPKVLFYEILDDKEFLCLTKLVGETLDKLSDKSSGGKIVQHYARALKLLHSLPIDELALKLSLEARLENAQYNLLNQVIDYEQLDPVNRNVPPNLLYQKLVELVPKNLDLVFTHGDYCLDNLIYDAHQLSGFIDLGNGGVADRYQDIALAIRSIRHDLGDQFVSVFLKEYGLEDLDQQKVEFFQLLDEFF